MPCDSISFDQLRFSSISAKFRKKKMIFSALNINLDTQIREKNQIETSHK